MALQDVFALMKERLKWEPEPEMQLHVFAAEDVMQGSEGASHSQLFDTACSNSDVFLAVDMKGDHMQFLDSVRSRQWPAFLVLDSDNVCFYIIQYLLPCNTKQLH